MEVDPGEDSEPENPQSWNKYAYVRNNPINATDPTGKYIGVDDVTFAGVGAIVGVASQGFQDVMNGKVSGWQSYTAAAVGGAVGGWLTEYAGPVAGGAVGAGLYNGIQQGLNMATGEQDSFDMTSLAADTAIGGVCALIPGASIEGVTAGRGSFAAVSKQVVTKLENGTISNVSGQTVAKMGTAAVAQAAPGAMIGSLTSNAVSQGRAEGAASGGRSSSGSKVDQKIAAHKARAAQGPAPKKKN